MNQETVLYGKGGVYYVRKTTTHKGSIMYPKEV